MRWEGLARDGVRDPRRFGLLGRWPERACFGRLSPAASALLVRLRSRCCSRRSTMEVILVLADTMVCGVPERGRTTHGRAGRVLTSEEHT